MCAPLAMPDVDLDTVILEALDWDFGKACEWTASAGGKNVEDCDELAEWIGTYPCCGSTILLCSNHRAQHIAFVSSPGKTKHLRCGGLIERDLTWELL